MPTPILCFSPARRGALAVLACLLSGCAAPEAAAVSGPDMVFAADHAPQSAEITLARAIADRYIAEHPAESLGWDWGPGILLDGFVDLYRVTGEPAYRDYLQRYLDTWIARGHAIEKSDDCPPALAAVELHRETGDPRYEAVVDDVLHYLYHEAPRTSDGGISHFGRSRHVAPTLWVDSLFMFGSVLVRWSEASGDLTALDTYGEQLRIFASHLEEDTGLFEHAYHWSAPQDGNVYWARGNGWVIASVGDYLRVRALRGQRDLHAEVVMRRLADAVVANQDRESGLWWTVVNRPGKTYLETSASALFALGLARGYRAGALDAKVLPSIHLALRGLRSRIVNDPEGRPVVTGISGPTNAGTFAHYADVPIASDLDYGVGAVLLALVEVSGLP